MHGYVTRKLEFDAGHRIPNHESKCRAIHGHRYVLEVSVRGPIKSESGASDEGMVIDFSVLKRIMNEEVVEVWDHSFLRWKDDPVKIIEKDHSAELLAGTTVFKSFDFRVLDLDFIPTVENLAVEAFRLLDGPLAAEGIILCALRLYETPNCWFDIIRDT